MKNEVFYGSYKSYFEGFVTYKRSLGYGYGKSIIYELIDLNNYLEESYIGNINITKEISHEYIAKKEHLSPASIHRSESMIRQFSIYLSNIGCENIYIYPENHIKPLKDFIPYIFSKKEMEIIFKVTDDLPKHMKNSPNYRLFYQTIIRLLYGTGMRISEALSLKIDEVDLINNILTISNGKGNVSRLAPINNNIVFWLKKYRYEYSDNLNYFFEYKNGQKRDKTTVSYQFNKTILVKAGIARKGNGSGPRLHDLRHTFACHALDQMIRHGKDSYCALPYLSTYLGHKGIESTEKYLRLTEEHFKEITDAGSYIYDGKLGNANE